ncbi:MAG: PRC-barrel domain-containing protein [Candidatus Thorarchaeota archaeon]|nr:MAG: PRC-barrel domain-containing protein [Candidatus Thorarchaeota archaeon]
MEIHEPFCCRMLKDKDVVDSSSRKIGRIGDFAFLFDGELKFSHFMMTGSRWEELLEALNLKPDHDPVFDSTLIKKVDAHIHLNTTANKLMTAEDRPLVSEDEIRFSELETLDIIDKDNVKVGRAIDVDFDVDGRVSIIAGGGFIEEKLEAIGLKEDVDIIVPSDVITSIENTIRLSVSKDELDTTLDGVLRERAMEIRKEREAAKHHGKSTRERVYAFWPYSSK